MSTYRGALSRKLLCFSIVILNSFLLHSALRIKSSNALVDYTGLSRERVIYLAHQHISYDVKMDFKTYKNKVMVYGRMDKLNNFRKAIKEAQNPKLKEQQKNKIEVWVFAKDTLTPSDRTKNYNTKGEDHVDFMIQKNGYRILYHNNQNHEHDKDRKFKLSDQYDIKGYHRIDKHDVIGGEHCVIWSGETSVDKMALRKVCKLPKKSDISELTVELCLKPYPPQCFEFKVDVFPIIKFKVDGKGRKEVIESLRVTSKIPYEKNKMLNDIIKKKSNQYDDFFGGNFFFRSAIIPVLEYRIYARKAMPKP